MAQTKLFSHKRELLPSERIKAFRAKFPNYPPPYLFNGSIYGIWICSSFIKNKGQLYGSYPRTVLKRIRALFPDCENIGHLFSGTIQEEGTLRFDISPRFNPTICDDIRNVKKYADDFSNLEIIYADPPYEGKDFTKYGVKPFDKPQVIRDLGDIMKPGSYLCWLDTRIPSYNKQVWALYGYIAILVSTNTRVRCWSIWRHI